MKNKENKFEQNKINELLSILSKSGIKIEDKNKQFQHINEILGFLYLHWENLNIYEQEKIAKLIAINNEQNEN